MKKFLFLPLLAILFCGCASNYLVIGDLYAPTAMDERERVYVDVPPECSKILYHTFYMQWPSESPFRLYKAENSPLYAVWRLPGLPQDQAAFGTVFYKAHQLEELTQDALTEYASSSIRQAMENSGIAVVEHRVEDYEFSGEPAIKVVCVYHNQAKTSYSKQTTIVFFCPESPENFIYYISWFQRGTPETYLDLQMSAAGEKFFGLFNLR